jgi:hypothetical protein
MRWADRFVAIALFLVGIGVAWKSTELPIGILPKEGPGGGFLPFWLSLGISICALAVFAQSFFRKPAPLAAADVQEEPAFVSWHDLAEILRVGIPGGIMILLISVISIYLAAAAFVFYCLFFVGRHKLPTSIAVTIGVPVAIFFIFEKFLIIPLPKGYVDFLFYWN